MDLIEALIKGGFLTKEQFEDAQDRQRAAKKPLTDILLEMGFVKEDDLMNASATVFNMPVVSLDNEKIDSSMVKLIPYDLAKRYGVFPLRRENDVLEKEVLVLATNDPQDINAFDYIKLVVNMPVRPVLASRSDISKYIEKYYQLDDVLYDLLKNFTKDANIEVLTPVDSAAGTATGADTADKNSPVVKLANLILVDAVETRASDIHIEPREGFVCVRYRIDGNLKNIIRVPNNLQSALIARIKVLGGLDIAESRRPQDGRARIIICERKIDLRISTIPTVYGEKVVMRILDAKEAKSDLAMIGFEQEEASLVKEVIARPQGMVLVTGPTGSGKTSTLYAALNSLLSETRNIVTVEDPVEYLIEGVNQIQVNPQIEVTFSTALRSILRQDPNVILVGEIRDSETAEIAFRASLTGHLVFSTLHTNTAVSTITRLLDMGLEPYLVSSSIIMIIAQRLVRVVCPHCKEEYRPEQKLISKFKPYLDACGVKSFYHGRGCRSCDFVGYRGRTAIFEILTVNEKIRALVSAKAGEDAVLKECRKAGMKLLAESGINKVAAGATTLEEVARVADIAIGQAVPEKKPVSAETAEKTRILMADDDQDILFSMGKHLERAGYEVFRAQDGAQAVESAFRVKPDLILMDANMPSLDGFEAVKVLRSRLETTLVPIIMITGIQDKESELRGFDAGVDDYLTKPCDIDKLLARIRNLLNKRIRYMTSYV